MNAELSFLEKKYDFKITKPQYLNIISEILSLFKTGKINDTLIDNPYYLYIIGLYYEKVKKDNTENIRYQKMAIEKGNSCAMNSLGWYYFDSIKNYPEAIKYFQMAIDKDQNCSALNNMGWYHYTITKNYQEAVEYFQLATSKGHVKAICNLA